MSQVVRFLKNIPQNKLGCNLAWEIWQLAIVTGLILLILKIYHRLMKIPYVFLAKYRKILKISPGAYIFQRPFLKGLSVEGNLRWKSIGLDLQLEGNLPFLLCFTLYLRVISKSPGGLYLERRFDVGFFALRVWGAYTSRGSFSEFYGISVGKSAHKTFKIFKVKHIDRCWIQSIFNNDLCSGNFITKHPSIHRSNFQSRLPRFMRFL